MCNKEAFLNLFQRNKSSYYQYSPTLKNIEVIKQLAVEHLKLYDFFQLRARFEGLVFYERLLSTICSIRTIEDVTGNNILPTTLIAAHVPKILSLKYLHESSLDLLTIGFDSDFEKLYSFNNDTHIILQRNEKSYHHLGIIKVPNEAMKNANICNIINRLGKK